MNVTDSVRKAVSPQAALLVVAQGIDEILKRLDAAPADSWGPWSNAGFTTQDELGSPEAVEAELEAMRPAAATIVTKDELGSPEAVEAELEAMRPAAATIVTKDEVIVDIKPVSTERQIDRLAFAAKLGLDDQFGEADPPWAEVYAKGGPLWLYNVDRAFVMSLPVEYRQAMVVDVAQDDDVAAQDLGADLLKDTAPQTRATALPMADIIT